MLHGVARTALNRPIPFPIFTESLVSDVLAVFILTVTLAYSNVGM